LLADIKQRIRQAQTQAVLAVNAELIRLYWEIGQMLDARQKSVTGSGTFLPWTGHGHSLGPSPAADGKSQTQNYPPNCPASRKLSRNWATTSKQAPGRQG